MSKFIRSDLFFLHQFGFSSKLLEKIYLQNLDPIKIIFNKNSANNNLKELFTEKDLNLSTKYNEYNNFKKNLYFKDDFFKNKKQNKIYFKYDENAITSLIPSNIMPLFLYAKGDISLLSKKHKRVAIIGTREPTENSINITEKVTRKFIDDEYIIVSGLANGIDSISHRTTINHQGKTIAVLPTNFHNIYPKNNKRLFLDILEKGLALTSIGPNENTYKSSFLDRNKYIANICDIIVVIETNLKSGTMNTIKNASQANKKILFIDQKDATINNKLYGFGGEMLYE